MTSQPDCPLCPANNLLKVPIIAQTDAAYVMTAISNPGNFLIVPKTHVESAQDLPDTWWQEIKALLSKVPDLPEHYNISINIGQHAGQSVKHLHFWVVPRAGGQPASGKGLALLIREANQSTNRR